MAIEENIIADQLKNYIYNSTVNWRTEASAYKTMLANGNRSVADTIRVMKEDAMHHERLLTRVALLASRNLTKFSNAVAILGATVLQAKNLNDSLIATAQYVQNTPMTTEIDVNNVADYILTHVPNYDSLH